VKHKIEHTTQGYDIPSKGIHARFKTEAKEWESELAAITHAIATGVGGEIISTEPVAFHSVRIRGLMTEATHPYVIRANEVLKTCDIISCGVDCVEYSYRPKGFRGKIKYENYEKDIDVFNRNVGVQSELADGYSTHEPNKQTSAV
jgi:hypothetical protein